MPFQSKAQERAAFAGGLGSQMQAAAPASVAAQTNQKTLPTKASKTSVKAALVKKLKGGKAC